MKKFLGTIKKKSGSPDRNGSAFVMPQGDAPEAVVVREVAAFCESGAPNSESAGDEYLHLPAIVDAAESSPTAAKEAAAMIRRYLSKENYQRGYAQYNAVMLLRILTDNPAHLFTQNFDSKFVSTVKDLIRDGKDASVQQILRETLDHFEAEKAPGNDTLGPLVEMWRKEKGKRNTIRHSTQRPGAVQYQQQQQQQQQRRPDVLPSPEELASRIEEAKTTARLLVQTVQSTSQSELLANDLVREFAERARTAQRSMQKFMNCQNPAPDPDTMLTMIETSDQLNIAMSKHQRAVLGARKAAGVASPSPHQTPDPMSQHGPMPQHNLGQNVYGGTTQSQDHAPYAASPPQRQNTVPTSFQSEEVYAPPPGPPPPRAQAVHTNQVPPPLVDLSDPYNAPEPAPAAAPRAQPPSHGYSSSADYGVGENPFADEAYGAEPVPQQKLQAPLDPGAATTQSQPQQYPGNEYSSELPSEHGRPGPYNAGYQPTPSYMHRQESSAEHVTMHGGNSPPTENGQYQSHPITAGVYGGSNTATTNPIDETQGVGRRMNDLRI